MTISLADELFENVRNLEDTETIEDFELNQCTFVGAVLVQHVNPNPSLVVRGVRAIGCTLNRCRVSGVRFEDVTLDGLSVRGGTQHLHGCIFSHVKISGKIGPLGITSPLPVPDGELVPGAEQALINAYRSIDWAVDISEAEFAEMTLNYVPGDLVRRDPRTQFLLRRDSLSKVAGRELPDNADILLNQINLTPFDSTVVVAPTRSKQFRWFLETLEALRDMGLAE
ncbi:hypothetical protein [Streptomyces sp. NPDC059786]|uniref:hypothetical protein n=1 Tax=Streptomyces sp. NPDC059786 TaxID=3346946 RepID=UPI00366015CF